MVEMVDDGDDIDSSAAIVKFFHTNAGWSCKDGDKGVKFIQHPKKNEQFETKLSAVIVKFYGTFLALAASDFSQWQQTDVPVKADKTVPVLTSPGIKFDAFIKEYKAVFPPGCNEADGTGEGSTDDDYDNVSACNNKKSGGDGNGDSGLGIEYYSDDDNDDDDKTPCFTSKGAVVRAGRKKKLKLNQTPDKSAVRISQTLQKPSAKPMKIPRIVGGVVETDKKKRKPRNNKKKCYGSGGDVMDTAEHFDIVTQALTASDIPIAAVESMPVVC